MLACVCVCVSCIFVADRESGNPGAIAVAAWVGSLVPSQASLAEALANAGTSVVSRMTVQEACMYASAISRFCAVKGGGEQGPSVSLDGQLEADSGVSDSPSLSLEQGIVALDAVAARILREPEGSLPRLSVSQLLWALARTGVASRSSIELFQRLCEEVLLPRTMARFDNEQLSLLSWCVERHPVESSIRLVAGEVKQALLQEVLLRDASAFLPQTLSLLAWAATRDEVPLTPPQRDSLLSHLLPVMEKKLPTFPPLALTFTAVGVSKALVDRPNPAMVPALERVVGLLGALVSSSMHDFHPLQVIAVRKALGDRAPLELVEFYWNKNGKSS